MDKLEIVDAEINQTRQKCPNKMLLVQDIRGVKNFKINFARYQSKNLYSKAFDVKEGEYFI